MYEIGDSNFYINDRELSMLCPTKIDNAVGYKLIRLLTIVGPGTAEEEEEEEHIVSILSPDALQIPFAINESGEIPSIAANGRFRSVKIHLCQCF